MKIFFIRNVPDNIPWPQEVLPVMPGTPFPRNYMNLSCFFLPVCHCGTLYSKSVIPCARPKTALWRPAARQLQSDGSLRLITFRSSASSMLRSRVYSYSVSFFSRSLYLLAEFCSRLIGAVFDSSVTQLSQPSWSHSYGRPQESGTRKISYVQMCEERCRTKRLLGITLL